MKTNKFLNFMLPIYFFVGMLKGMSLFQYADYIISLVVQIYIIAMMLNKKFTVKKSIISLYFLNLLIISIIGVYFVNSGVSLTLIINRILPLISIFGLVIINASNELINIKEIIDKTIKYFIYLSVIIILDACCYFIFSKCIWNPVSYLGMRFSGPFYDSNFMAITYGIVFLLTLYRNKEKKKVSLILSLICILLAKSWSTIIFLILTIIIHTTFKIKFKNIFMKQLLLIVFDILFIFICSKYMVYIYNWFIQLLNKSSFSLTEIIAKFKSFEYRINAQKKSLVLFSNNIFGYGPRTIVKYLNMDIHNSYLGFMFEQGILGLILQIINIPNKKNKVFICDIVSTFIFIVACFINIHYSSIFVFVLTILFNITHSGGDSNEIFNNTASI